MYVLPHGTKSILRLCSNDIFIKKGLYYAEFFEKLFMRNPKHYIVSGPSVPEKDFTNKRNARKFLFQNSENGYDAMIDCLDTDPCCK